MCGIFRIGLVMLFAVGTMSEVFAIDGLRVNARVVSVQYRHGWLNWGAACTECYERVPKGSIVMYTINNNLVAKRDTIYRRTQGFAEYPAFNFPGTKVAFFRYGYAPTANEAGTGSVTINDGKKYISIINIDKTGLTDLVEITGSIGAEQSLHWPAGNWIYYVRPGEAGRAKQGESVDVWRVNAVSRANEKVCDLTDNRGFDYVCSYIRRFTLTAKGDYMATQIFGGVYGCTDPNGEMSGANAVIAFPPTNCNIQSSSYVLSAPGCNIAISPSGSQCAWYMGGWHTDLYMDDVDYANKQRINGRSYSMSSSLSTWAGEVLCCGAELVRWSVNSDKWVLQQFGWNGHADGLHDGSNTIAANWVDHAAINVTKNPNQGAPASGGDGTIFWNGSTGSMWVDGGSINAAKYEDRNGAWQSISGYTNTDYVSAALSGVVRGGASVAPGIALRVVRDRAGLLVALPFAGECTVEALDMQGRVVARTMGSGLVRIPGISPAARTLVVKISSVRGEVASLLLTL